MRTVFALVMMFGVLVSSLAIPAVPAPVAPARQDDASRAADTALQLSEYEAEGTSGGLYDAMHLDAKVIDPARSGHRLVREDVLPAGARTDHGHRCRVRGLDVGRHRRHLPTK